MRSNKEIEKTFRKGVDELRRELNRYKESPFKDYGGAKILDNSSLNYALEKFFSTYYKKAVEGNENELKESLDEAEKIISEIVKIGGLLTLMEAMENVREKAKERILETFLENKKNRLLVNRGKKKIYHYSIELKVWKEIYESFDKLYLKEKVKSYIDLLIKEGFEYLKQKTKKESETPFGEKISIRDFGDHIEEFLNLAESFGFKSKVNEIRRGIFWSEKGKNIKSSIKNTITSKTTHGNEFEKHKR